METLPTTASGTLSLMPETKDEIKSFANILKAELLTGWESPLKTYVKIKSISMLIDTLESDPDIRAAVLAEAEKYGQKSFEFGEAKVSIKEVGVRYDYTACGCEDWTFHNNAVESHKRNLKQLEEFLKRIPEDGMADPATGEIIYPPAKKSTTSVVIELK